MYVYMGKEVNVKGVGTVSVNTVHIMIYNIINSLNLFVVHIHI